MIDCELYGAVRGYMLLYADITVVSILHAREEECTHSLLLSELSLAHSRDHSVEEPRASGYSLLVFIPFSI